MTEHWLPIPRWEDYYEVSDHGRVRSVDRRVSNGTRRKGRVLKPSPNRTGHLQVRLAGKGHDKYRSVHSLVMLAFVGPRPTAAHDVCHYDGNPGNNHLSNLRYDTKRNNQLDNVRHGKNVQALRTHCPRGHELADWNNVTWYADRGRRTCRSCGNARTYARNLGLQFDPAKADEYYLTHQQQKEIAS
jgi:NUMOD4 motif/HNH endonuclease